MKNKSNKARPVELIIDRSKWARGNCTRLYNSHTKKMDCLGFIARQICGASIKDIADHFSPADCLNVKWSFLFRPIDISDKTIELFDNTPFVRDLIGYNDSQNITDKKREKELTKLFKSIGINVKFIGKYTKK